MVVAYATLQMFVEPLLEKDSILALLFVPRVVFNTLPIVAVGGLALASASYLHLKTKKK
jgi:hypothetical protein